MVESWIPQLSLEEFEPGKGELVDKTSPPAVVQAMFLLAFPQYMLNPGVTIKYRKDDQKVFIPDIGWM